MRIIRLNVLVTTLAVFSVFFNGSVAQAHVLITDTTGSVGAVFHVNPDDDPVAGEVATLSLTPQVSYGAQITSGTLIVTDDAGIRDTVQATVVGNGLLFSYTFPTQGVYKLQFTIVESGSTSTFDQSQLVSRGVARGGVVRKEHPVAEGLILISGLALVVLFIVLITRWKGIAERSTS